MWVLGPSYDHVPADERWTMLADLANVPLTADVVDDLVTDLVASMGDQAMVRAVAAAHALGSLHVIAGNRVDPADLHATSGAPVIGPAELIGDSPPGERQVDRLRFGASYDAGRYTEPGDVVF